MGHQSLYKKYLTPELKDSLRGIQTVSGFTIEDAVRSGADHSDSNIGVYAGDAESYDRFAPLFDRVIEDYHNISGTPKNVCDMSLDKVNREDLDPSGKKVISTRIRVGRNLAGFAFAPAISKEDRLKVEGQVVSALETLSGDLAGKYYPLTDMPEDVRVKLVADHFLFKKGDRFLESAGVNRDWPSARGIFHSDDKKFLVWVNEEDQLRIISMQMGGDVFAVYDRLVRAITTLEAKLNFAYSDRLGFLSSCPTNLGTAMRASVHVDLSHICKESNFKQRCDDLGLSVRGIHGEHSESEGGIFDISNKERLGVSEVEIVEILQNGVRHLLG